MSTKSANSDNGTEADQLPGAWSRVPEDDLDHNVIEAFVHQVTGQMVTIRRQRRPTQMHTPETSTDDTGYVTWVYGDDNSAKLSYDLSAETVAGEIATDFLDAYPEGDYDVPEPEAWDSGPAEW